MSGVIDQNRKDSRLMNLGIPKLQGQFVIFTDPPGPLVELRFGDTEYILSSNSKSCHSLDVALVLEGTQAFENLTNIPFNWGRHGYLGTRMPMASAKVLTGRISRVASGSRETAFTLPWGMTACLKPSRAASAKRGPI